MYDKLIILYTANYCKKIKDFFMIDDLLHYGLDVEFWNCGKITIEERLIPAYSERLSLLDIDSVNQFDIEIKRRQTKRCLYMTFVNYAYYSYGMYLTLSKNHADILYAVTGVLPLSITQTGHAKLKRFHVKNIIRALRDRWISAMLFSNRFIPMKFLLASSLVVQADYKVSSQTIKIPCNSGDFEAYRKIELSTIDKVRRYAVFLDQYIPYHNDNHIRGTSAPTPEIYYSQLNSFFSFFENQNNCDVIIAAHPSAQKYKEYNPFDNRKIVFDKTIELVKESMCVLAHCSTAISFAVIDYKPIILLSSDEIENHYFWLQRNIEAFGKMLGCRVQNISQQTMYSSLNVNRELYKKYKYSLLTSPESENFSNAEIIRSIAVGDYSQYIK